MGARKGKGLLTCIRLCACVCENFFVIGVNDPLQRQGSTSPPGMIADRGRKASPLASCGCVLFTHTNTNTPSLRVGCVGRRMINKTKTREDNTSKRGWRAINDRVRKRKRNKMEKRVVRGVGRRDDRPFCCVLRIRLTVRLLNLNVFLVLLPPLLALRRV